MNKKGFTLVELLAVIVILAIIALIATPVILNVIEKSKKGAAENSALGYIEAVEKQKARNLLDEDKTNDITDGTYSVEELNSLGVSVKGSTPTNGNLVIKNGEVKNYILGIDGYAVENGIATKTSNTKKYENGYAVYYNPVSGEKCSASDAVSTTETKTGCMKWYVFNDSEGSSTVNVILDHNTTARVVWNTVGISGTNVAYADSNIKPEIDKLVSDSQWKSIPRLITADEVNTITGKTGFDASNISSWYFLDTKTHTKADFTSTRSKYDWLYNNLYLCKTDSGCSIEDNNTYSSYGTPYTGKTWGYWISTPVGTAGSGSNVWVVYSSGALVYYSANYDDYGVRPVITISKSIVS